jgi:hypothetical protein
VLNYIRWCSLLFSDVSSVSDLRGQTCHQFQTWGQAYRQFELRTDESSVLDLRFRRRWKFWLWSSVLRRRGNTGCKSARNRNAEDYNQTHRNSFNDALSTVVAIGLKNLWEYRDSWTWNNGWRSSRHLKRPRELQLIMIVSEGPSRYDVALHERKSDVLALETVAGSTFLIKRWTYNRCGHTRSYTVYPVLLCLR